MSDESDSERFLAIISHELRTPTAAILGWAEMLRRKGADGEVLTKGVEVISRNARQIVERHGGEIRAESGGEGRGRPSRSASPARTWLRPREPRPGRRTEK